MTGIGGSEWLWLPHVHWGVSLAIYLFLGGMAGGAYITSIYASALRFLDGANSAIAGLLIPGSDTEDEYRTLLETSRWGSIFALIGIAIGGVFLITHLGAPLRALLFPVNFSNYGSWMVIGTWFIVLFTIAVTLEMFWLHFGRRRNDDSGPSLFPRWIVAGIDRIVPAPILRSVDIVADRTRPPSVLWGGIRILGVLFAMLVLLYTGMELSDLSSVPLWNRTYLPAIFFASGISTGISAAVVGTMVSGGASTRVNYRFNATVDVLLIVEAAVLALLVSFLIESPDVGAQAASDQLLGSFQLPFLGGVLVLGIVVPLLLSLFIWGIKGFTDLEESAFGRKLVTGGFATKYTLVLVGGYFLRHVILLAAVKTPLAVPGL